MSAAIPADIMEKAWAIFRENFFSENDTTTCIAKAIMDERERCAKIAEGCGDRAVVFMNEKLGGYSNDFQRYSDGCMSVARFIRDSTNSFGSGAKAAADSPAPDVSEASPTRTGNTIGDGNHG